MIYQWLSTQLRDRAPTIHPFHGRDAEGRTSILPTITAAMLVNRNFSNQPLTPVCSIWTNLQHYSLLKRRFLLPRRSRQNTIWARIAYNNLFLQPCTCATRYGGRVNCSLQKISLLHRQWIEKTLQISHSEAGYRICCKATKFNNFKRKSGSLAKTVAGTLTKPSSPGWVSTIGVEKSTLSFVHSSPWIKEFFLFKAKILKKINACHYLKEPATTSLHLNKISRWSHAHCELFIQKKYWVCFYCT